MSSSLRSASFSDTEITALQSWTQNERKNLCLTIWVDSQSLQVALCPAIKTTNKKSIYQQPVQIGKAADLNATFEKLRNNIAKYNCTVIFATMSFAGPVSQDHVVVTNWKCEARERVIHFTQLPFDLFPLDRRRFMNDLEAASYGIIARSITHSLADIFSPIWPTSKSQNSESITLDGSSLVLSIGSGFGVSYICCINSLGHNCVVSSEAGHTQAVLCSTNDPEYEKEKKFVQYVSQKLHGGAHMPEWEDLCACRGLELAYQSIKIGNEHTLDEDRKWPNYDEIRDLASKEEPDMNAIEAFKLHYRFLMRAAQTMVLGIQCQRVFVISQVQVQNYDLVMNMKDELQQTFVNHPRKEWISNIAVYAQRTMSMFPLSGGLFLSKIFAVTRQNQTHNSSG